MYLEEWTCNGLSETGCSGADGFWGRTLWFTYTGERNKVSGMSSELYDKGV